MPSVRNDTEWYADEAITLARYTHALPADIEQGRETPASYLENRQSDAASRS
jgi:hypothetical protein